MLRIGVENRGVFMAIVQAKMRAVINVDISSGRNSLSTIIFFPKSIRHLRVIRALMDKFEDGYKVISVGKDEKRTYYSFCIMKHKQNKMSNA